MPSSLRWRFALVALTLPLMASPALRAVDEGLAAVQLQLGDLLFREARYAEAAEAYEQARAQATGGVRWRAAVGLVQSLLRGGEFQRARGEAEHLADERPSNPMALSVYGDALWAVSLFDEAEVTYRKAATLESSEARARNGLARALAARNLLEEALDEAQEAVALAPLEPEFQHTRGYVLERLRRYEQAAAAFRRYISLLPNKRQSDKALWASQQVRFLESFGTRQPLAVAPDKQDAVHTVPFRLRREKVIVMGRVNGRRMEFVLDTGAEMTVISQRTARRQGVEPVSYTLSAGVGQIGLRGLQVGRLDTLEIGTLKVENVPVLIKSPPLTDLPTREVESFSPLSLGYSMHINYNKRLLTMARTLPDQSHDVELSLRHHRLAFVRGQVNGANPVHFVVDTGGEVISMSRATVDSLRMWPARRIPLKVYGTSGWDPDAFLLTGVDLAFDEISMPRQPVVVLNLDAPSVLLGFELGGIVGHKFLSKYQVSIDLRRSVLGLDGP